MKKTNLMRSIQFQIIIILVAVVTIILLGFGINDYLKIEHDLNEKLEKTAGRITSRLSLAMVTPIWDFDEELARRIISSEMDLEELYAVFVYDGDDKNLFMALEKDAEGKLKTATVLPEGNLVMQAADIVRKDKTIGVVNIYLTRDILEAAIAAELRGIIVNTLIIDTLIILILFIVIRTKLIQPVKVIQTFANDVSEGNLDSIFGKGNFSGELIDLKDAVLRMVANLKKTIEEVGVKEREAAESAKEACKALTEAEEARLEGERARQEGMQEASNILKDISENIMTAADEQAQRVEQVNAYTTQQRDRASETATAMEEMNATVLEVAQNASLAAESADSSKQKASFGFGKVSELVASINDVSSLSETMKTNLQELGRHAEGIGSIMNVITDIADQTNLLALNAAIEAARAGDAGRGFAVVADEVRKLAEKTVHATQEVEEVVRAIQNSSNQNIKGMEATTKAVDQSKELAGEAGTALSEILSIVESTSDQVRSIATASEEQSASSEEINRAMEDINTIANDISSDMQRATNALMRMKELSTKLMELIRKLESE